jgi:prevent-host-death family protein
MVSKSKFKAKALHYFREVEKTGRPLIISDRGKPVLKLVPYTGDPLVLVRELRHTVVKYEKPTAPVGLKNWEVLE